MRKAAITAAAIVLAAILLAILLPRLISLEAFKPRIVALLEEKTGRKVALGKISLSLIPGIGVRISDLSVSGDPGHAGETLLSVPEAEIRAALLPLLTGRLEFDKILLRRPEVLFRTYRDGTHSATQIAGRIAPEPAKAGEGKAPPRKERISVALKAISIEEAKFTLVQEGAEGGETRWRVDPLTLRLSGIGGGRNDFHLKTRIDGDVRGEIEFDGSLEKEGGIAAAAAAYRLEGKGKVFGQPLTVDGKASTAAGPAKVDLAVALPKIDVGKIPGMFARPPVALSGVTLRGEAALTVKVTGSQEGMGIGAELRFSSLSANGRATLSSSTGARDWSGTARVASLSDLGKSLGEGIAKWAPVGGLTVTAAGKRTSASAKESWNATMDLNGVGAEIPDPKMRLTALSGHLELSESKVDFQPLAGSVNGQRFTLRGPVSLGTAPAGTASLRMSYLDLDALFPPGEAQAPAKKKEVSPAAGKDEKPRAIAARAEVRIDSGRGRGLEFQDLAGTGRYEDGTLFLDSLMVRLYGGSATVSGRMRLGGTAPEFKVKAAVKDVAAGEILSRKTSLKDYFTGKATGSADVAGGAKDFADFSRTAVGSGSIRVVDGRIKGIDLLDAAGGLPGVRSAIPQAYLPSGKLPETKFSDLSADFRIGEGKIRTDSLRIVSDRVSLTGAAVLGFDRNLDFRGTLVLSREISERIRGKAGQFLAGSSGRAEIPVRMSGPVTSPRVSLDPEGMARDIGGKAIRKLLDRAPGSSPPAGTEREKAPEKPPDKTDPGKALEGLFQRLLPGKN
jgi:AsmA protein